MQIDPFFDGTYPIQSFLFKNLETLADQARVLDPERFENSQLYLQDTLSQLTSKQLEDVKG